MPKSRNTSTSQPGHWWLVVVGLLALWFLLELLGWGIFNNVNKAVAPTSLVTSTSPAQTKTFTASSVMGGFTIEVPEGFEVEEMPPRLELTNNNYSIVIDKSATNFNSLDEYLEDLVLKNKNNVISDKRYLISHLDSAERLVQTPNKDTRKTYTIFKEGIVYTISSNSESLYTDLDQIVQSFRIPEK